MRHKNDSDNNNDRFDQDELESNALALQTKSMIEHSVAAQVDIPNDDDYDDQEDAIDELDTYNTLEKTKHLKFKFSFKKLWAFTGEKYDWFRRFFMFSNTLTSRSLFRSRFFNEHCISRSRQYCE
jgi:hypothetical protein